MPNVLLGPALHARPSSLEEWSFAVHITTVGGSRGAPRSLTPTFAGTGPNAPNVGDPELVHEFDAFGIRVWAWTVTVARGDEERALRYRIDGRSYGPVAVPARGQLPRFAFFSCNGFSNPAEVHKVREPEILWSDLLGRHKGGLADGGADDRSGIHLLIGGGDQIYCDALWSQAPLAQLAKNQNPNTDRVTREQREQILARYVEWYVSNWGRAGFSAAYSCIPAVYTWDDHDIFDGWGSHPEALQATKLHQAVFAAARETFVAFQLGGAASPLLIRKRSHFLQTLALESATQRALVVLADLRGDRNIKTVLSPRQWNDLGKALKGFENDVDGREAYLLFISSIPLVYRRTRFEGVPAGGVEDDRRDQWEHGSRRGERARLIRNLLDTAGQEARAVAISGDVHVASRGRIVSTLPEHTTADEPETAIPQVTSSAMVHPAPSWIEWLGFTALSDDSPSTLSDGIRTEVLPMTPEERCIRARNYVIGTFVPRGATPGALWFQWLREDDPGGSPSVRPVAEQLVVHGRA